MMFHVGQKVVCVSEFLSENLPGERYPKIGHIYTVRTVEIYSRDGDPYIRLYEIINPQIYDWDEDGPMECRFWADRFRPVTERKTDISVFTAMLTGAPNNVERVE